MLFNSAVPSEKVVRSICSYVCQDDDALLPYLTVRENLHFSAGPRLPAHFSKHEKLQRAESVLLEMGLCNCANNLVGSEMVKGINGVEKRRVTIAVQILTNPRVLFLDEPTSGLDVFTASSIIEVFRALADVGRTLVLTHSSIPKRSIQILQQCSTSSARRVAGVCWKGFSHAESLCIFGV